MVFNAGISAYTSDHIINCFDSIFNAVSRREKWKEKETIIIFAVWINDSAEFPDTKIKRVDANTFKQNLDILTDMCKREKLVKRVIFLWVTNVEEEIINQEDSIWAEHFFYNSDIQKYNQIIQEIVKTNNYDYIDVFGLMGKWDLQDWLHPNPQWHRKIYEKVLEYLEN